MGREQWRGRGPQHSSRCPGLRQRGLCHPLDALLLCDIGSHAQQQWDGRVFARPLSRGQIVGIGRKLDGQVAPVHGAAIPFQPEPQVPLTSSIVRQCIGPQVVPLFVDPVAPFALRGSSMAQSMVWLLACCLREPSKKP